MNAVEMRRPLENVIGELVDGLSAMPAHGRQANDGVALQVTGVEVALPIETRVVAGPTGLVVHADMPTMLTRTSFDLPVGRLVLRLVTVATEVAP
jgi:hypothetical protein